MGDALSERVGKVVGRRWARWANTNGESSKRCCSTPDAFEDLPGKWRAAILKAEQNPPKPRACG